jgi:acetyl-CoA synthetase
MPEKAEVLAALAGPRILAADHAFMAALEAFPDRYDPQTAATDMAIFQYTSGTTREMPDAIKHTHRAIVVVMNAALYGTGLRPGDRFFCPSSPAWGHGLWHGTLAPLALGIETGAYAGKFEAERLLKAMRDYGTTNLSAAATHYRMMKNTGHIEDYRTVLCKL